MADADKPILLIVDDDEGIGQSLRLILRKSGYEAEWVTTGEAAVVRARELSALGRLIQAALIDIRLPDRSGLEVLREIRRQHEQASVVMMTGFADVTTAVQALNEGAFAYIQKPASVEEIKAILARAMERHRLLAENRELMETLRQTNASLEQRVRQRTLELQRANLQLANTIEKLREADEIKSEFVSMVSHELRTPMTIIMGYTQTLLMRLESLQPEQLKHYLGIILNDARRLSRLIENMLDLSKMRDRNLSLLYEPFNIKELIAAVAEGISVIKTKARLEISVEDDLAIVSDKDRVKQILINIIGNAAKYSPEGGTIRMTSRRDGPEMLFSVEDEGPGIPEAEREKIFEAFYRTQDAINMKSPGTGLGLTITLAILQALGGRIRVEAGRGGRGSVFSFILPLKPEGALEAP